MFSTCETSFRLSSHLIDLMQDSPFFCALSRMIRKVPTQDKRLPTAAITFDVKRDEVIMFWNPDFFSTLTKQEIRGVLVHEFYHFVFGHLSTRRKQPHKLWNISTDLAINSIILSTNRSDTINLPDIVLLPGREPTMKDCESYSKEQREAITKIHKKIASLPLSKSSEWYHKELKEEYEECAEAMGNYEMTLDAHEWDNIPEDMKEYIEGRVRSIVEQAANFADSHSGGWGDIPSEIREGIRRMISSNINWRFVLRQFLGSTIRGGRNVSIKRINKRYPYVHPGITKGYTSKILVAIDESGSVDDKMLTEFFSELSSLARRTTFDIIHFDCACSENDIYTWKKGSQPALLRKKTGGTDFDAPSDVFNDPKNKGRWDGLLIMTDGAAPKPKPVRGKRAWVLGKGQQLVFQSDELQINIDDSTTQVKGSWM